MLVMNPEEAQKLPPNLQPILEKIVEQTIQENQIPGIAIWNKVEVCLSLVDDRVMQSLNREYRGIDTPTDVLSFSQLEDAQNGEPQIRQAEEDILLGDILVSWETAQRQSQEFGHSLEREISFLVLHGLLHLLGYDHQTPETEKEMSTKAETILSAWGILP